MKRLTSILILLCILVVLALEILGLSGRTCSIVEKIEKERLAAEYSENDFYDQDNLSSYGLEEIELPSYYNCEDYGLVSSTKDQGDVGSCWAFAANMALESRLLPDEVWDFSEDHMLYNNGFSVDSSEGGDYCMAMSYLTSWMGPVREEDDIYNDGYTNTDAETVKHLQEALFIEDKNFNLVKYMIMTYGPVVSSIYISMDEEKHIDTEYYNEWYNTYCYTGEEQANHEICIIGWDDSCSLYDFNTGAYRDGAFICINSWGSDFGDNGVFYVSYCDTHICDSVEVYTRLEGTDNYDHIYQNDTLGWVGRIGFEDEKAYFANVYTAENDELLKAVSFYATDINTMYKIYVCDEFSSAGDLLADRTVYAEGILKYAGYYTIDLDEAVQLSEGERFAVVVEIKTPGSEHPIAIEMNSDDGRTGSITLEGKESYVSANGRVWERSQENSACNVCLKAFTDNR